MTSITLPELELELINLLAAQGLPVEEIYLIGLLGKGTRATVFSVIIDDTYHVLKVYDSKESLQSELKNLRKIIPKERLLFWWEEKVGSSMLNFVIVEVPEGKEFTSASLNEFTSERIATHLAELHNLKYRQQVSVSAMQRQLRRYIPIYYACLKNLDIDLEPHEQLIKKLTTMLKTQPDLFRVNKVRVHGDLWWPNIIIAKEDVYFIDWESLSRGDACGDITKLRLVIYWDRNNGEKFFWDSKDDSAKIGQLVQYLVRKHKEVSSDLTIEQRLKYYLPFKCISTLCERYLAGVTETVFDRASSRIVADEALRLADDPLSNPPDLGHHGYYAALEQLRSQSG